MHPRTGTAPPSSHFAGRRLALPTVTGLLPFSEGSWTKGISGFVDGPSSGFLAEGFLAEGFLAEGLLAEGLERWVSQAPACARS